MHHFHQVGKDLTSNSDLCWQHLQHPRTKVKDVSHWASKATRRKLQAYTLELIFSSFQSAYFVDYWLIVLDSPNRAKNLEFQVMPKLAMYISYLMVVSNKQPCLSSRICWKLEMKSEEIPWILEWSGNWIRSIGAKKSTWNWMKPVLLSSARLCANSAANSPIPWLSNIID